VIFIYVCIPCFPCNADPVCAKLKIIGFFKRFGSQWVFPSIQGAVEFAKSGQKVVSIDSASNLKQYL